MPKKQFKIQLPVKPHIRKFVHLHYGQPVHLSHHHQLGSVLLALLEKKTKTGLNNADRLKRIKHLTATVECFAATHWKKAAGDTVPDQQIIAINRMLEAQFEQELYAYVKYNVGPNGRYPGYMQALRGFMEEYHISEEVDMPFDTLKKIEYRHRRELQGHRKTMPAG